MYSSMLSGNVARENWPLLEHRYTIALKHCPEGLVQSFLLQSTEDPNHWHILTIWRSYEVYEQACLLNETETCTQLFCDAGSVPQRVTYHVPKAYQNSALTIAA